MATETKDIPEIGNKTMIETINVLRAHDRPMNAYELDKEIAKNLNLSVEVNAIEAKHSHNSKFRKSCGSARTFLRHSKIIKEKEELPAGQCELTSLGKEGVFSEYGMKEIRQKYNDYLKTRNNNEQNLFSQSKNSNKNSRNKSKYLQIQVLKTPQN